MNNYKFKIEYMNDENEKRHFEISTYYKTYDQAFAFMLGYLLECEKEENIIVMKIEYII